MFGAKISSVLASGILLLGSSAIALAQGGPPTELPTDEVQNLELEDETATNRAPNQDGDEDGLPGVESHDGEHEDATAFSEWVEGLELTGCQRGQTVAKYARQGPRDFDPATVVPVPESELPGNCAAGGEDLEGAEGAGDGPPDHAGRPDHAGEPGPPPHAGQPGPPPHARAGRD